jgi:hypothetical protein
MIKILFVLICTSTLSAFSYATESPNEYARISVDYLLSTWDADSLGNAETKTTGQNILKLTLDFSPLFDFITPIEYWTTPGNKTEQKRLLEATQNDNSAFERFSAGFKFREYYYRFEKSAYIINASIINPIIYLTGRNNQTILNSGDTINYLTEISDHEIGYDFSQRFAKDYGDSSPISKQNFFKLLLKHRSYSRPYTLTNHEFQRDDVIFDSHITGLMPGISGQYVYDFENNRTAIYFSASLLAGKGNITLGTTSLEGITDSTRRVDSSFHHIQLGIGHSFFNGAELDISYKIEGFGVTSYDKEGNQDGSSGEEHLDETFHFFNAGLSFGF